jgi:hypothetical protein
VDLRSWRIERVVLVWVCYLTAVLTVGASLLWYAARAEASKHPPGENFMVAYAVEGTGALLMLLVVLGPPVVLTIVWIWRRYRRAA